MLRLPAAVVSRLRETYQGQTVCVTGGAGFIGGHLVDALLTVGASVVVIDDLSNATAAHLSELIELEPDRMRFIQGSILEDAALEEGVERALTVFHLAALGSVPRSIAEPERTWQVNGTGTVRVLEACRHAGVSRVVYAGSSSAYGEDERLPKVETQVPAPASPYAASKLAGEHLMRAWASSFEMSTVSLRYFNVFGPRQPADSAYAAVIPAFCKRILSGQPPVIYGDGTQSRDFTFVGNVVVGTLLAGATAKPLEGEVMNLGTGQRTSLVALAGLVAERAGKKLEGPVFKPARAGDVRHSVADSSRARELLGYEPVVSLEDGLDETIGWCGREAVGRRE